MSVNSIIVLKYKSSKHSSVLGTHIESRDGTISIDLSDDYNDLVTTKRNATFDELQQVSELYSKSCDVDEKFYNPESPTWHIILDTILSHLVDYICTSSGRLARILLIGDSHIHSYVNGNVGLVSNRHGIQGADLLDDHNNMCAVSNYCHCGVAGASAHGLLNLNSSTGAASAFENCFQNVSAIDFVAISVGEVDVRSVAALRGVSILAQIRISVNRLFTYIHEVVIRRHNFTMQQVLLLGAPFICPQIDLTTEASLHAMARFNEEIRRRCFIEGCRFAYPADDILDLQTGEVKKYFWSKPNDMHCSPKRTFFFLHRAIKEALGLEWCAESAVL